MIIAVVIVDLNRSARAPCHMYAKINYNRMSTNGAHCRFSFVFLIAFLLAPRYDVANNDDRYNNATTAQWPRWLFERTTFHE